jgi:hypothetical protein
MAVIIDGTNGITTPGEVNTANLAMTGSIILGAGTTTVAPLDFTAGTNLTTALAGAMEYDGKVIYATPQGTQRGVVPGQQFFRLDSNLAGANVNTAQSMFGAGVTLSASTVYRFEALVILTKAAGSSSHNIGLGFGGTATINNFVMLWQAQYTAGTALLNNSVSTGYTTSVANVATTNNIASSAQNYFGIVRGTVSVNAGGTFIPQYTLSAAPGGAYSTVAGTFFLIYPIGASGANTSVGTWA